jgi:polysaccharide biosynthesis/export protein
LLLPDSVGISRAMIMAPIPSRSTRIFALSVPICWFGIFLLALVLSGCASLPSNAPTVGQVRKAARYAESAPIPFSLVRIDANVVAHMAVAQHPGVFELSGLATSPAPERADLIRRGDTLTIMLFEVGVSLFGGSTTPAMAADSVRAPTAGAQTLILTVREDGAIDLPYIGTVQAAGTYPETLGTTIKQRLRKFSESPDVVVNITDSLKSAVYVSGAVIRPGRVRLTAAHEHLLDVLALAGGSPLDVNELQVTLVRGAHTVSAPLNQIGAADAANVTLLPGDRIVLERVRPSYTVFGATDRVSQVPFDARTVNLAEALARAAGPADSRANPRGVYVFRLEKADDGTSRAVIYELNMLRPDTYFIAQLFPMRDKDVILFANSSTNAAQKALGLISNLFNPFVAVKTATQ